jgi:uncharacterized protein YjbI with pentapeptide repeats
MEPTIRNGKQLAEHACLSDSRFRDVNLSGTEFDDVNLSRARLHNVNLSDITVTAANLGGAHFRHIGPMPNPDGSQERQKQVVFEEAMLCDSVFKKVDLSGVKIEECNIEGMTIDGVLVTDLLSLYNRK